MCRGPGRLLGRILGSGQLGRGRRLLFLWPELQQQESWRVHPKRPFATIDRTGSYLMVRDNNSGGQMVVRLSDLTARPALGTTSGSAFGNFIGSGDSWVGYFNSSSAPCTFFIEPGP